jgi:ribose/xylose/arabinose/galactoside ABC-type transport system permease subunit
METETTPKVGGGEAVASRKESTQAILKWVEKYATVVGFLALIAIFWLERPGVFGTWDNARSILELAAPILILAAGLTVVLSNGEFDLSFPGVVGLSAVVAVQMMSDHGQSAFVAVIVALAVGIGCGMVGGILVAFQRASSFIVTLALQTVWTGVALGISGGGLTIANVSEGYISLTFNRALGIPLPVIYAAGVIIIAYVLMRWTVFGRRTMAIGSNPGAARLAGIRVGLTKMWGFALMGLCSGIAAVILSSQTGQYSPDIAGGLFIPPFVAAFFGISVLAAGRFNVIGTTVGALFVATLQTGLTIVGASSFVANIVIGTVLIVILFVAAQSRVDN